MEKKKKKKKSEYAREDSLTYERTNDTGNEEPSKKEEGIGNERRYRKKKVKSDMKEKNLKKK